MSSIIQKCGECDGSFPSDTVVCPKDGCELQATLIGSLSGMVLANRFELIEEIGQGGMGIIYKAIDQESADKSVKMVAVKLLLKTASENESLRNRFTIEARAARSLNHPNIVRVIDHDFTNEGLPFIAMEWLAGTPLDKLIDDSRLDIEKAIRFVMQICNALSHAHRHNVVHRDVKPANIMIVEDVAAPKAVLVDFGIAKIFTPPGKTSLHLTQTGQIFGSPHYMSPEQCMGQKIDARSDIYSLGCVLYESVTGATPFTADNALAIIFKHVNEDPQPFASSRSEKALEKIIFKAMAKRPEDRYQSTNDMSRDIETYLRTLQGSLPEHRAFDELVADSQQSLTEQESKSNAEKYFQYYKGAAEAGEPSAQLELSLIYLTGDIVEKDANLAFEWCLKAASQGYVDAMAHLGEMYKLGDVVELDYDIAYFWYHKAALQDHPYCCRMVGHFIDSRKVEEADFPSALKWYKRAAMLEDVEAQKYLGYLYFTGEQVERDLDEAQKWMKRAANQGDAHAQFVVGTIHHDCEPPELDEAESWFIMSAEQGHPDARRYLAKLLESRKQESEAVYWMEKAAEMNDPQSLYCLAMWHKSGLNGLPANSKIANKLLLEAAKLDDADAQCQYGLQLLEGDGVAKNAESGVNWLKKAARKNHPKATYKLALCYRDGSGVHHAEGEYSKYLKKAAELDYADAQNELAMNYLRYDFPKLARQWLIKAAQQGHEEAAQQLEQLGSERSE